LNDVPRKRVNCNRNAVLLVAMEEGRKVLVEEDFKIRL